MIVSWRQNGRGDRRRAGPARPRLGPIAGLAILLIIGNARGDEPGTAPVTIEELARRLQNVEAQNAALSRENRALTEQLGSLSTRYDQLNRRLEGIAPGPNPPPPATSTGPAVSELVPNALPLPDPTIPGPPPGQGGFWEASGPFENPAPPRFRVGDYDNEQGAFVLVRPTDAQRVPFELRLDLITQARYTYFGRTADFWVDSAGTPQRLRNFDSVEIMRNFIAFSGFGLDPRLQYSMIIFSSTALNDTVYLGWINYRFSDAFDLRVGNWIVPGTREWFESFRYTMGTDRLMATTFFRPNISPGIWGQGEPIRGVHYVAMLANSVNRFTQGVERIGSTLTFGGTLWWEPRGAFGPGPSDAEFHEEWTPRLGTNLTLSRERNQAAGPITQGNPEDTILRLSDGTPLFRAGALGEGIRLLSTDVQLWTIDAGLKYRGLGLSGEYFLRWLGDFQFDTASRSTVGSIFDHGGLLQAGYFLVPRKFEGFARASFVQGPFGGGEEYGGGVNWYVLGRRDWRFTLEVLRINRSPAQNILTGYRAGESGMLYQLQWLTDF